MTHNPKTLMKQTVLTLVVALCTLCCYAQTAQEEIRHNACLSAANLLAYPTPTKSLSPAPQGKAPFYISHYARHGSRYLDSRGGYHDVLDLLERADSAGALTARGQEVLQKVRLICAESENRYGDLTPLGAEQHRAIAHRMYVRFPEVFADSAVVNAKSTVIRRSMLSMANELLELKGLNPQLRMSMDASQHDMYYMNADVHLFDGSIADEATRDYVYTWEAEHLQPDGLLHSLFSDLSFFADSDEQTFLYKALFNLACAIQNTELRHDVSLYELFSSDELYTLWQCGNLFWHAVRGPNALDGGKQIYSQVPLLRKMIEEADSCIALGATGATLRFGHDTIVMPLACLMNLNGYGELVEPRYLFDSAWVNYRIFPMACNIQIVFYRADKDDADVWVKVLLNEEEATLPLPAVEGCYYRWCDVKDYYNTLLATVAAAA